MTGLSGIMITQIPVQERREGGWWMPNEAATWIEAEKGKKRTPVKRAGRAV
jgi:hypothetical protein